MGFEKARRTAIRLGLLLGSSRFFMGLYHQLIRSNPLHSRGLSKHHELLASDMPLYDVC